ncbi:hypothetical protein C8Q79DRAFT_183063 [Trametes meyenii]|nr:hypothetical protein C8Q79DRAFT_183063 [Trametes meyenii]
MKTEDLEIANASNAKLELALKQGEAERTRLEQELSQVRVEHEILEKELGARTSESEEAQASILWSRKELSEAQAKYEELTLLRDGLASALKDAQASNAELEEKLSLAEDSRARMEQDFLSANTESISLKQELDARAVEYEKVQASLVRLETALSQVQTAHDNVTMLLDTRVTELEDARTQNSQLEDALSVAQAERVKVEESLLAERDRLKEELDARTIEFHRAQQSIGELEKALLQAQVAREDFETLSDARTAALQEVRALKEALSQAQAQRAKVEDSLARTQAERDNLTEELQARTTECQRAQASIHELDATLARSHSAREEIEILLNTRVLVEEEGVQTDEPGSPGEVSDGELVGLVDFVNSQTTQIASEISDHFAPFYGTQTSSRVVKAAVARLAASAMLGPDLPGILQNADHKEDAILAHLALQVVLTAFFYRLATPGLLERRVEFRKSLYAQMRKHDHQATSTSSSKSEATLTFLDAHSLDQDSDTASLLASLTEHMTDVLLACGVGMSPEDTRSAMLEQCGEALQFIIGDMIEFRRLAGERRASNAVDVFIVPPAARFYPSAMDEEWGDQDDDDDDDSDGAGASPPPVDGTVLYTTSLGVVRRKSDSEPGERLEDGEGCDVVLLKPRVVLESTFAEELEGGIDG